MEQETPRLKNFRRRSFLAGLTRLHRDEQLTFFSHDFRYSPENFLLKVTSS